MPTADTGDEDNSRLGEVGPQVHDKHARLRAYVEISAKVRAKFTGPDKAGASYIDLYCGPGRSRVRESEAIVEGSAIVAVRAAHDNGHPFTVVHIGDVDSANVEATAARLRALGTSTAIVTHSGPATTTVREVAEQLSPWGLHFAFLDPYNLGDLSFSIIEAFAPLRRADLLINICAMDLQRNLEQALTSGETHHFDIFAPGWRDAVDRRQPPHDLRRAIRLYWVECVRKLGFQAFSEDQFELVRGAGNQPLYWLALAAKNQKASEFWEKIRHTDYQRELDLSGL